MEKLRATFFKYRSYSPIPFLAVMFLFQEATIQSMIIGFAVAVAGELTRLWGVCYAGSETRTTGSVGGSILVVSGPFGHVRNPLYVGNILMYLGIGIMSMALFPYLQIGALLFFLLQYKLIIDGEEAYLKKEFGESYAHYYKNVPRLIPRISRYKNPGIEQPVYNLGAGLKSERRTLQAFTGVTLLLVIIFVVSNI